MYGGIIGPYIGRRVQMLRQSLDAKYAEIGGADDYIPILYHTPIIIMMMMMMMMTLLYIFNMHFCYDNDIMMHG